MSPELVPVCVLGGIAVTAILGMVAVVVVGGRREDRLRLKLGSCRTSLEACEAERDMMRKQFNAQAVELARYRGSLEPHHRLTQVFTGLPPR
jgi:hypothetical protein